MDELVKAIEKLTEEVKKLQAQRVIEHHYHYNYAAPTMLPQPNYSVPYTPPYLVATSRGQSDGSST